MIPYGDGWLLGGSILEDRLIEEHKSILVIWFICSVFKVVAHPYPFLLTPVPVFYLYFGLDHIASVSAHLCCSCKMFWG